MGDNSVVMISFRFFDNGESNSTMANQIVYSPIETILEGYFAHKWCHHHAKLNGVRLYCVNLLWCFTFTVNSKCPIGKVNYTDLSMSYCFNESMQA